MGRRPGEFIVGSRWGHLNLFWNQYGAILVDLSRVIFACALQCVCMLFAVCLRGWIAVRVVHIARCVFACILLACILAHLYGGSLLAVCLQLFCLQIAAVCLQCRCMQFAYSLLAMCCLQFECCLLTLCLQGVCMQIACSLFAVVLAACLLFVCSALLAV